jgi:two-component system OmpR family sensor kinase
MSREQYVLVRLSGMTLRGFLRREPSPAAANRHVSAFPPRAEGVEPTVMDRLEAARQEVAELRERQRRYEIELRVLRQALDARDAFLAVAGHELRNPMGAIALGVSGLLFQTRQVGDTPAWLVERLEALERQTRHFVRRSTTLLEVNRLAAGKVDVDRSMVDLGALAGDVIAEMAPEAARVRSALQRSIDAGVEGFWDRAALEQVVRNVLSNAIRYGAGQPVDIFVRGHRDRATFAVRDRGPGIAEVERARVFDPFERAVAGRERAGFGLGLWIARQLVRGHGGEIQIETEAGIGTAVTATFPRFPLPAKEAAPPSP